MEKNRLGSLLKGHRANSHKTQKALAYEMGYHWSRVSQFERGKELPSLSYLEKFIRVLNLQRQEAEELLNLHQLAKHSKTDGAPNARLSILTTEERNSAPESSFSLRGRHLEAHRYYELCQHEKILAQVIERLQRHHERYAICLCGNGGIGKTTLALEAATRLLRAGEFVDALWCSLRQSSTLAQKGNGIFDSSQEFARVLDLFAVQMGLEEVAKQSELQKRQTVADHFWAHRYLVLMDNLEDSVDAVELVHKLLSVLGNSRLLITMRDRRLNQLDLVWIVPVSGLGKRDASNYLQIEAHRMGTRLGKSTLGKLQKVFSFTMGIPYALKRVLSQIQNSGIDIAVHELDNTPSPDANEYYMYAFSKEWNSLDDHARRLWIFLGRIMPASIAKGDLIKLELNETDFGSALQQLVDHNLVESNMSEIGLATRLSLHPLAQQFLQRITSLLMIAPVLDEYYQTGCVQHAAEGWQRILSTEQKLLHQTATRANIMFCIRECDRLGWASRVKLFWEVISTPLYEFGYWNDYEQLEKMALRAVQFLGDRVTEGEICSEFAWIAMDRGEFKQAEELARAALQTYSELDNRRGIVIAHRYLATIKIEQEDFVTAKPAFLELLELIQEYTKTADAYLAENLRRQEITTRDSLGIVLTELGEFEQAERELQFGYKYALERGPSAKAISLFNLGVHWMKRENLAQAKFYLEDCFQFSNAHNFQKTTADALFRLAIIADKEGDGFKARELGEQACRRYHHIGASVAEKKAIKFVNTLNITWRLHITWRLCAITNVNCFGLYFAVSAFDANNTLHSCAFDNIRRKPTRLQNPRDCLGAPPRSASGLGPL